MEICPIFALQISTTTNDFYNFQVLFYNYSIYKFLYDLIELHSLNGCYV